MIKKLLVLGSVCVSMAASAAPLSTYEEKVNYILGRQVGTHFKAEGVNFLDQQFVMGVNDGISDQASKLTEEEIQQVMNQFRETHDKKVFEAFQKLAQENQAKGKEFLEKNAANPKVKTTSTGLQYEVVKEGQGPKPKAGDEVVVNYKGMFIDGKEFDSSYSRGEPTTMTLNNLIQGWMEVIPMMNTGSTYKVFIPASLAYGESGNQAIGPNETLIFEIELISVNPKSGTSN